MHAESAYLFRHALLRDAAYQLQLPADRAHLHALAFAAIERLAGGRPPEEAPMPGRIQLAFRPHASDAMGEDLAEHARLAPDDGTPEAASLKTAGRRYLQRAAEHAERNFRDTEALWRRHAATVEGLERAESLRRAGAAALRATRWKDGRTALEEARAIGQSHRERRFEASVLGTFVTYYWDTEQLEEALRVSRQALALYREMGIPELQATELSRQAGMTAESGKMAEAERLQREALAILEPAGDSMPLASALHNLGVLLQETGRPDEARLACEEALRIARAGGNRILEGAIQTNLGSLHRRTGKLDEAGRCLDAALQLHRETGNRRLEGMTLAGLGNFHADRGEFALALEAYQKGLAINRDTDNRRGEAIVLGNLGVLCRENGREREAEPYFLEALRVHREIGNRRGEGVTLGDLADLRRKAGDLAGALEDFERALALDRQVRNSDFEGLHLCCSALALVALGRIDAAKTRWREGSALLRPSNSEELARRAVEMNALCAAAGIERLGGAEARP